MPPIHFLLEELSRSPELSARTKIIYGGRSSADILLRSDLERLTSPVYATEDGSRGLHGRVTGLLEPALASGEVEVFACGPMPMLQAVARSTSGRAPCQVSMESHMACGFVVCLGCVVPTAGWPDG